MREEITYFKLSGNAESSVAGTYPQLEAPVLKNYISKSPNSYLNLDCEFFLPQPEINVFKLKKRANLTNVLSCQFTPQVGFFVDEKTKMLLERFNIINTRMYPADIYSPDEKPIKERYFFTHIIDCNKELIDLDCSVFIDIRNNDEKVMDKSRLLPWHRAKEICIRDKSMDLFRIPYSIYPLVSERLANAMMEENIMGLELTKSTYIKFYNSSS